MVGWFARCLITGNEDGKAMVSSELQQIAAKLFALGGVARADDNHAAAWQGSGGGQRIGQALIIRHQNERRQACAPEPRGRSCQLRASKSIAHP